MTKSSGSSRGIGARLSRAFMLQATFISVAAVVGVVVAGALLERLLIREALRDEAAHFWEQRLTRPDFPLPSTRNLTGYMGDVPDALRPLGLGYHPWQHDAVEYLVYVSEREGRRLYLTFDRSSVGRLAAYYGLAPLALVLLVLYLSTWLGFRASRRALSPVMALARSVRQLDPNAPDPAVFEPARLPMGADDEVSELSAALAWFAHRLNEFTERERHFTRDASHELRSPLTVIQMASDVLLQGTSLGEPERRAVERIRRSARDMEELTAAFLLLARESEVGLPTETVRINDVVATELERALPLAEGRPVALQIEARCCLSINAPEKVLSVLIGNLLRNAVAYTNAGRVHVEILADAVVIEDTGVGLPAGRIREMGQPFVRGSTGRPGYGVGLTIVRRLSDRFGWPVEFTSQAGVGTRVRITFPGAVATPLEG
jgi:signal transduction histidine kinase